MSIVDKVSSKIANFILNYQMRGRSRSCKLYNISEDIVVLRHLKDELLKKEEELSRTKIEWDRTFDAIIDDITIIDSNFIIRKSNRSFIHHLEKLGCVDRDVVGLDWRDVRRYIFRDQHCLVEQCFETKQYTEGSFKSNDDKVYSVLINPIYDDNFNVVSVVRVSRDITGLEQQKERLDRRGKIFEAIGDMSKILVNHDNWHRAVYDILSIMGNSLGASRTYIFKNMVNGDRLCADLIGEWVNHEGCTMTECINYDVLPEWRSDMELGRSVEGKIYECLRCSDKEVCLGVNDLVVCAVPIYSDKKWWGFIGFDYNSTIKKWKEEDESLLRVASDIIGGVIYHRERYYEVVNNK